MNGIHDAGGTEGYGNIIVEENEPYFHQDWERKAFGMTFGALGQGLCKLDEFRHAVERMHPVDYLTSGYYGHWIASIETLMVEKGYLDAADIEERTQDFLANPDAPVPHKENPELANNLLMGVKYGAPTTLREIPSAPRFQIGDHVKTRNIHPPGHTRLPRYARGKHGVIHNIYGAHVLPDANAHGDDESPQYLYSVRFEAEELWGEKQGDAVYIDLWESHLE